jgi:hypothetical protein
MLWDLARKLMLEKNYPNPPKNEIHPRTQKMDKLIQTLGVRRVLDAAIGTGIPTLIDIEPSMVRNLYCSDGDAAMLNALKESFGNKNREIDELLSKRTFHIKWSDLPASFNERFDLVMILGNSLGLCTGWQGEEATIEAMKESLLASLKGVRNILSEEGKFLFSVSAYTKNARIELGSAELEGSVVSLYLQTRYEGLRRYWTIGTEHEKYTLVGLAVEDIIDEMLKEAGFMSCSPVIVLGIPELDPVLFKEYIARP